MVKGKKPQNKKPVQKGAVKKVVKRGKASGQKGKGILGDILHGLTFGLVPKGLIPI